MTRKIRRPRPVQQIRRAQATFNKYRVCEMAATREEMVNMMALISQAISEVESGDDVILFHFLSVPEQQESIGFKQIYLQRLGAIVDIFPANGKGHWTPQFQLKMMQQMMEFIKDLDDCTS